MVSTKIVISLQFLFHSPASGRGHLSGNARVLGFLWTDKVTIPVFKPPQVCAGCMFLLNGSKSQPVYLGSQRVGRLKEPVEVGLSGYSDGNNSDVIWHKMNQGRWILTLVKIVDFQCPDNFIPFCNSVPDFFACWRGRCNAHRDIAWSGSRCEGGCLSHRACWFSRGCQS